MNFNSKIVLLLAITLFTFSNIYAQTSGEFIPLTKTYPNPLKGDPELIKGNMVVFGNSILGFKANDAASPNDEYNAGTSNSSQRRGYIDIDSDPDRDTKYINNGVPIFQNLLNSESDYKGFPGTLSNDETLLSNGEAILDFYGAPNYGNWVDGSDSIVGPFETGTEEGTFSSSAAELKINSNSDRCSRIKRAYLYWSGLYTGEQFISVGTPVSSRNYLQVTRERPEAFDASGNPSELYTDIRILPPGADSYVDIKRSNSGIDENTLKTEILYDDTWDVALDLSHSVYNKSSDVYPNASFNNIPQNQGWLSNPSYACRADITHLMQGLQDTGESVEGFWTVANIRTTVGRKAWGLGAGWSIVLVYEDPLETEKYISFFDGYVNATSNPISSVIGGFATSSEGPINVEFASLSLEGDIGLQGDNFKINGTSIAAVKPVEVVSDIGYDNNNYMDSSILSIDRSASPLINLRRFPNSLNNLGYDSDHFVLDNTENSIISNGSSSANLVIDAGDTSNDQSSTYFTALSVEVNNPRIQLHKEALDTDRNVIAYDQVRDLGDEIRYRITLKNMGDAESINTIFKDVIPINTVFDSSTADFSVSPPLPSGYDFVIDPNYDSGETDINGNPLLTTRISLEIPDSLDTINGEGFLEPGDEVVIEFSVNIVADCRLLRNACSGVIENQASLEFASLYNPDTLIRVNSAFEIYNCGIPNEGPTIVLADQAACNANPIVEILCIEEPLDISGGNGFDVYEWYFDNPAGTSWEIGVFDRNDIPFTTDAEGNATANQETIAVLESGFYHVYQELTGVDCQRTSLTYELQGLDFFNPNIDPFVNATNKNELLCTDTNAVEVTEILICDLNESITLGSTEYPAGTDVFWQKLDDSAGCTTSNDSCSYPYTSNSGNPCFAPAFSKNHTEVFDFNDEGVYRLTVIPNGGCPFEYYFNIISYGVTPNINIASGGECNSGDVFIELTGVDIDASGVLDGYTVDFVILDTSNNIVSTLANDSTTPSITIPASSGNARVRADVSSNNGGPNSCVYLSNIEDVTFFDLDIDTVVITRDPSCFEDRSLTTTYDDNKGDVRIELTGNSAPFYHYYLKDVSDNSISQLSGQQGTDYFEFKNVDPGNYIIEAFSSSNTIATTDPIPNCAVTSMPFEIIEVPGYRAVVNTRQLSCNPSEINVIVESLDFSNPIDFSDIIVRFTDVNDTSNTSSFSYSTDGSNPITFTVDDSSVINTTINPNTGDFIITDSGADMYIDNLYRDESRSNPFDNTIHIEVFNSSCPLDIPNIVINSFDKLELTIDIPNTQNPSCRGANDGRIAINAIGDNLNDISGYEIINAEPDPSFIGNISPTGVFENLTDGSYTIEATQSIGFDICTASIEFTLIDPIVNCTTLSNVELETAATNINIYPIPTKNKISIANSNSLKIKSIEVYSILGELVITKLTELNSEIKIDLSELKEGVYIAKINTEKGTVVKKIVKN